MAVYILAGSRTLNYTVVSFGRPQKEVFVMIMVGGTVIKSIVVLFSSFYPTLNQRECVIIVNVGGTFIYAVRQFHIKVPAFETQGKN